MRCRIRSAFLAIVLVLLGAIAVQAAPKPAKLEEIEAIISEFIDDLSVEKFDDAARAMSILGTPYDGEPFRKTVLGLDAAGKPMYNDKIIDKFYGKTGKDIVYKIMTDSNAYFVRFVLHKREAENWVIGWLAIQTEMQAPLPKAWTPIFP